MAYGNPHKKGNPHKYKEMGSKGRLTEQDLKRGMSSKEFFGSSVFDASTPAYKLKSQAPGYKKKK